MGQAVVTSLDNRQVKAVRELHQRKFRVERHETLVEGTRLLEEVLTAGVALHQLVCAQGFMASAAGATLATRLAAHADGVLVVSDGVFAKLATTEAPQGVLAVIPALGTTPESILETSNPLLLLVDRVQDPGNLGTIVRTAAGAGATGILLGQGTVELSSPKVMRATMGAAFRLAIATEVDLEDVMRRLDSRGVRTVAGDPRGEVTYFDADLRPPLALLVGNEANGPSPQLLAMVAQRVRIPMTELVESLNVGVASGLLLYESLRQRGGQVFPCHRP